MPRRLFFRHGRPDAARPLAAALAAALATVLLSSLAIAHPGHEEAGLFDKAPATLTAQGRPCDKVVEIEKTPTATLVTCRVQSVDKGEQLVAYRLPKQP